MVWFFFCGEVVGFFCLVLEEADEVYMVFKDSE
ncbi:MAG: hypothetical protein ACI857_002598 [Arenicella sp.]|jgi:hypothetical protein